MKRYLWLAVAVLGCGVLVAKGMIASTPANQSPQPVATVLQIGSIPSLPLHDVNRPGLYGLGLPPEGSHYAIVGNNLVRMDSESLEVQAVVRSGVGPINEAMFD